VDKLKSQGALKSKLFYVTNDDLFGIDFSKIINKKIECTDLKGDKKEIEINAKTWLQIFSKGKKTEIYFHSVLIYNDTIYGLKSMLLGLEEKIAIKNIDSLLIEQTF
jgi:predicted methyltransferase